MSKIPNAFISDEQLEHQRSIQRSTLDRATRDIVADGRRGNPTNPWPSQNAGGGDTRPKEPDPTYVEWAARRGRTMDYAAARNLYLTERTAGKDVGNVQERPQWQNGRWVDTYNGSGTPVAARPSGWTDPVPLRDWRAPGLAIMDQMMDRQDALDRRDRERTGR